MLNVDHTEEWPGAGWWAALFNRSLHKTLKALSTVSCYFHHLFNHLCLGLTMTTGYCLALHPGPRGSQTLA